MLVSQLNQLGKNVPESLKKIVSKQWPGELTIIYKSQGYRMPDNKLLLKVIDEVGPIWCTSANKSGCEPIKELSEVNIVFKEDIEKILVFKTTTVPSNIPSTIYDFEKKEIIREGRISKEELFD